MAPFGANAIMKTAGLGGMMNAMGRRCDEDAAAAFGRGPGAQYSPLFRQNPMMNVGRNYGRPNPMVSPMALPMMIPPMSNQMMDPRMMDSMYPDQEDMYPNYGGGGYRGYPMYPRRRMGMMRRKHYPSFHERWDAESEYESDGYWSGDDTCSGVYDRGYESDEWEERSFERRLPGWLRRRRGCPRCTGVRSCEYGCRHGGRY